MDEGSQSIPPVPPPPAPQAEEPKEAWPIPWFPAGCAAIAQRPIRVVLRWQLVAALICSLTLLSFLLRAWLPVINETMRLWPDEVRLASGHLFSSATEGRRLGGNARLAIVFNATDDLETGTRGDLQIELKSDRIRFKAFLGLMDVSYPDVSMLNLGRSIALPWWEAWRPMILGGITLGTFVILFATWWTLGTLYCILCIPIAYLADRSMNPVTLWKLANGAQLSGAFYVAVILFVYGAGMISLPLFLVLAPLHQLINWFYLFMGLTRLPRKVPKKSAKNPFDEKSKAD